MSDHGPYVYSPTWRGNPITDLSWHEQGVCGDSDPELFVPSDDVGAGVNGTRAARRICALCPVKVVCEAYALHRNERYGVWGGLSRIDRIKIMNMWRTNYEWVATDEDATGAYQEAA